jgi:hypothetical protein
VNFLSPRDRRMTLRHYFLILALLTALLSGATFYAGIAGPPEPERIPDGTEVALLAALDRGVPATWVLQTAWLESRMHSWVVGSAGELGEFQINPRWFPDAVTEADRALKAVELLAEYKRLYGSWDRVRFAYRAPAAAARRWKS